VGETKNPTIAGLDGSIIILFYLEQQHFLGLDKLSSLDLI
jgi:hypothetical protein